MKNIEHWIVTFVDVSVAFLQMISDVVEEPYVLAGGSRARNFVSSHRLRNKFPQKYFCGCSNSHIIL